MSPHTRVWRQSYVVLQFRIVADVGVLHQHTCGTYPRLAIGWAVDGDMRSNIAEVAYDNGPVAVKIPMFRTAANVAVRLDDCVVADLEWSHQSAERSDFDSDTNFDNALLNDCLMDHLIAFVRASATANQACFVESPRDDHLAA